MWTEMARNIHEGNLYIYAMLFFGFLGLVILFERLIMLQFVYNIDFSKFLNNLKKMIKAEDLDRALNLCKNASHTSLPQITLKAIEAAEIDPSTIKGTIEEEAIDFIPKIESRVAILPAIATLIFLIGILGTFDSLWGAFHSIDILDTTQKQVTLSHGIARSLSFTTMGLFICILFIMGHQILRGMAMRLIEKIQLGVAVLNNLLVPQEMAYVPMGGMPSSAPPMPSSDGSGNQEAPKEDNADSSASNEAVEDDTIEDIKDEEEII